MNMDQWDKDFITDCYEEYSQFSTENLEKEKEELNKKVAKMVMDSELGVKIVTIDAILEQRKNGSK